MHSKETDGLGVGCIVLNGRHLQNQGHHIKGIQEADFFRSFILTIMLEDGKVAERENSKNICCGIWSSKGSLGLQDDAETCGFKAREREVECAGARFRD
jgi:hypothetical protein